MSNGKHVDYSRTEKDLICFGGLCKLLCAQDRVLFLTQDLEQFEVTSDPSSSSLK